MRGGLCISPDRPGWGLLLMAVNALSAEAAGWGFWGLVLNGSPAREKEGWLVSQTHSQAPAGNLPPSDMCSGGRAV